MHLRFSCQSCPHYPPHFTPHYSSVSSNSYLPVFALLIYPHCLPSRWRTIQKGMNQRGERESNGEHKYNQREESRLIEKYTSIEEKQKKENKLRFSLNHMETHLMSPPPTPTSTSVDVGESRSRNFSSASRHLHSPSLVSTVWTCLTPLPPLFVDSCSVPDSANTHYN